MKQVQCVAVILQRGDRFLLGKRSPKKAVGPNYWCPISGKIEPGESEEAAVIREVQEELGIVVRPLKKITEFDIAERSARLHWWLSEIISGEPCLNNDENVELRWVTIEEMAKLTPIFQEDIDVYHSLSK
ncbi:MAG: NUDIX domain-containing protein [Bdellovibrionales bacterium]